MAGEPADNDPLTETKSEITDGKPADDDGLPDMARRSFLRAGAAAGALGVVGTGVASAADPIDIVEAGADPTGNEPINGVLERVVSDGAVVEFPSDGVFRLDGAVSLSADDFELRGNGARLVQDGRGIVNASGSGYVIDGFEIDLREATQQSLISLSGDGYTVRRIVFRGSPVDGKYKVFSIRTNGPDGATFEWIYFPDREYGANEPYGTGYVGAFGDWPTYGGITFRNCWFHGAGGTTFYMSQTKSRVVAENCYFRNTMNGPRVYNAELRNCTVVHDAEMMHKSGWNSGWMAGVWLNGKQDANFGFTGDPHVVIEDCDFHFTGPDPHGAGVLSGAWLPGPITVRNCRIHNGTDAPAMTLDSEGENFDISLEGVECSGNDASSLRGNVVTRDVTTVDGEAADPTPPIPTPPPEGSIPGPDGSSGDGSAGDGSSGGGSSGDGSDGLTSLPNDLRVEGTGVATEYTFEVSGELQGDTNTLESWDETNGTTATGWITQSGTVDRFTFDGELQAFECLQGAADVYVNDEPVDVGNDPSLANELEVRGIGVDTEYSFAVSDRVEAASDSLEGGDAVSDDGTSASGTIAQSGESDVYTFGGEVSSFEVASGEAEVYVNGSLTDLGNAPTLANALEVRCTGTTAEYEVTVSETIRPDYDTLEDADAVSDDDASASGTVVVDGQSDGYTFDGEVTSFEFVRGEAEVYVNGELTDLGTEPDLPNTLRIEGTGTPTEYAVAVSEALEGVDDSLENWDQVDGTSAEGWITQTGSVDRYRFAGEVSSFECLQGAADVYVNGEPWSQDDGSGDDGGSDGSSLPNELRVEGTGEVTEYAIAVTEALEGVDDTLESWDRVDGTSAEGWITQTGSVDRYRFAGEVASVEFLQGEADVYVNGEPWSQDDGSGDGGTDEPVQKELRVEGTGEVTEYAFEVTGSLSGVSDTLESWDRVDGTSATGWITQSSSVDRYTFTGELASLEFLQGEADVYVDGEPVDPR